MLALFKIWRKAISNTTRIVAERIIEPFDGADDDEDDALRRVAPPLAVDTTLP